MSHVPRPTEVENPSGTFTDLASPDPDTILLTDIAHRLAQVNRFGGAARHPYSVAQHAIFCAKRMAEIGCNEKMQLLALHHDDAEAYICDLPKPAKSLFGQSAKELAARLDQAVSRALGLPQHSVESKMSHTVVKRVDTYALLVEAQMLMPSKGHHWLSRIPGLYHPEEEITVPDYWMGQQPWYAVGLEYVDLHYRLMKRWLDPWLHNVESDPKEHNEHS